MVGFPFETNEDFEKTLLFIENIGFSYLHVFTYSPKPLTMASKFKEQISESDKKKRAEIMINLSEKLKKNYIKKFAGSNLDVIIEEKKGGSFTGTSDNYIKCIIENDNLQPGSLVKIRVNRIENSIAFGTVVK
jgi:threonylcarbamoyladenosine tRNA methylthiotransferase MtaB